MPTPPRYHLTRSPAASVTPGTVTIRLANVSEAEWAWLEQVLRARGWKPY